MDPQPEVLTEKPVVVTRGVQLLILALVLGLIRAFVAAARAASGTTLLIALTIVGIFFAVMFFLVWKISARRNWARFVLLVLIVIGLPFVVPAYILELRRSVPSGLLSIFLALLQIVGVILLFLPNANQWFRNRT